MSQLEDDPSRYLDTDQEEPRVGLRGPDILAVLAVSTFLAAIALVTFFVTTTFAS